MNSKLKKYVVYPSLLATLLITSAPYAKVYVNNSKTNLKFSVNRADNNFFNQSLDWILSSFGSSAFAECYGLSGVCIVAQNQCYLDDTASSYTFDLGGSGSEGEPPDAEGWMQFLKPIRATLTEQTTTELTITPTDIDYNNYPGPAPYPEQNQVSPSFSFQTPEVGPTEGPSSNGRITLSLRARGEFADYDPDTSTWNNTYASVEDLGYIERNVTITIDHRNRAPVVSNVSASTPTVQTPEITLQSVVSDVESNNVNVIYELSDGESFSNIIQTGTYSLMATPSGEPTQHTFTNLDPNTTYYWRIRAYETEGSPVGTCTGFSNALAGSNLSAETLYNQFIINAPTTSGSPTPTPTTLNVVPTVTTNPSGVIFEDQNGNGVFDAGEPTLPGINLIFTDSNGQTQVIRSDSTGRYLVPNFTNTFSLQLTTQSDVRQNYSSNTNNTYNFPIRDRNLLANTGDMKLESILVGICVIIVILLIKKRTKLFLSLRALKK